MTQPIDNDKKENHVANDSLPRDFATRQPNQSCTREAVATRLKQTRHSMALTQKEAAIKAGISLPSYKDYEVGKSIPGGEAVAGLMQLGINANWLLTGEGTMFLADILSSAEKPSPIDTEVLTHVIEVIEETLNKRNQTLGAARKAALIQLIYEYCIETGKGDVLTVEKYLKLVG